MADKIWIDWENKKVLTSISEHFDEINKVYSEIVKDDKELTSFLYSKYSGMADFFNSLLSEETNFYDLYKDFDNWCHNRASEQVRNTFEEIELK